MVAAGLGKAVEPGLGGRALAAVLRGDFEQRVVDVLGHALGVAADIEMRAFVEPRPELGRVLAHAMLNVDFLGLVARESEIELFKHAAALPIDDLVFVQKVRGAFLLAEEQPLRPLRAAPLTLPAQPSPRAAPATTP